MRESVEVLRADIQTFRMDRAVTFIETVLRESCEGVFPDWVCVLLGLEVYSAGTDEYCACCALEYALGDLECLAAEFELEWRDLLVNAIDSAKGPIHITPISETDCLDSAVLFETTEVQLMIILRMIAGCLDVQEISDGDGIEEGDFGAVVAGVVGAILGRVDV